MSYLKSFKLIAVSTMFLFITACSHIQENTNDITSVNKEKIEKSTAEYNDFIKMNNKTIAIKSRNSYNKGYSYKNYIENRAITNNLPEEIYALPAVESDFNVKIISASNAAGMWQLMPAVGREMGLTINRKVDERTDWEKSTNAALDYLGKSKERLKSNDLAILSYYTGVSRVNKAITKNKSENIWVLLQDEKTLGKGSKEYMFKYMAFANEFKKLNEREKKLSRK